MDRRRFLATPALALVGTRLTAQMSRPSLTASAGEVPDSDVTSLPELGGAVDWLNSDPLRRRSLRGKVVLVNFWTYSCINSLRPLPYVKDWAARYKDAGFVVIGVHTPEFGFEKERPNVEQALRDLKIPYPVPMDSNYKIWQAFRNEAWPAFYLADGKGRIRHRRFGEGGYDQSDAVIRALLNEGRAAGLSAAPVAISADGVEAPPSGDVQSPETYIGYRRSERFHSPERLARDSQKTYTPPLKPRLNEWGLSGSWKVGAESATLVQAPGSIFFRFRSRDLHLVLAPADTSKTVRFRVTLDGTVPGGDAGTDSANGGAGEVRAPRLYQLVRQKRRADDRTFQIEFLDPGVRAFAFTFG